MNLNSQLKVNIKMSTKFSREWAMPNHNTFKIKPIFNMLNRIDMQGVWLDPFSRNSPFKDKCITNDLSLEFETDYHLEALDFLKQFDDGFADGVLFDPPYSPRQISECYKQVGRAVHMTDTQSSFYGDRKKEVARLVKSGGMVVSFGWNSGGIGKVLGFEIVEIMMVAHGGAHNDTIVTIEIKK
jgi:hypothetical protein